MTNPLLTTQIEPAPSYQAEAVEISVEILLSQLSQKRAARALAILRTSIGRELPDNVVSLHRERLAHISPAEFSRRRQRAMDMELIARKIVRKINGAV